tara:strand:+ start:3011 stop:5614 length:2604 start_codon:yes stop_codon:yes gene_type:complete
MAKAMNLPPVGEEESPDDPVVMEIDIMLEDEDGYAEGDEDGEDGEEDEDAEFSENLAEEMEDETLMVLAAELQEDFDDDVNSRADWVQTYIDGIELLGLKFEDRSEPWDGACGVYHPLLAEALVKFQSETMMETFPASGPVKTKIIGQETPENKEAAKRVLEDMNYQLTERMDEYRAEHERMLWGLGLSGNSFKKVYYDPSLDRQVSIYVPAEDVVVPFGASTVKSAERITHVMRKTENEVLRLMRDGFYSEVELDDPGGQLSEIESKLAALQGYQAEHDERYKLLEMQVELNLEDDPFRTPEDGKVKLPYIVTMESMSGKVLSIRRNWSPDDPKKLRRSHFVHYGYVPGFGFYALGLIHLVGAYAKSGTSLIRQLVDAGTLSNLRGGFKSKGLRVKNSDKPIGPGEFRDVDVATGSIRDNIMPLPFGEPSATLLALLDTITTEGRRFANAGDIQISEMSGEAPVGTTLALLERTLKSMSAIQARIHYAMKAEFKLLKDIIKDYADEEYSYTPDGAEASARKEDYDLVEVIPVSDPNASTMAQKIVQYQTVMQMAQQSPDVYDMAQLHRDMLEVIGVKNADKLVPTEEDPEPMDPVSENMAILKGEPAQAFLSQDHESHLAVHVSAMQDPKIMELVQKNPNGPAIMAAAQAHIMEHIGFEYRRQLEEQAGVALPPPGQKIDPRTEVDLSRLQAQAAEQLLRKSQGEAQQKKNEQLQQDPLVQMQQAELQIKQGELKLKEQKQQLEAQRLQLEYTARETDQQMKGVQTQADIAATADKLKQSETKIAVDAAARADELAARERIEGLKIGAKIATDKEQLSAKQQEAGLRMGVEISQELLNKDTAERQRQEDRAERASPQPKEDGNDES